jgi:hypothetical protein
VTLLKPGLGLERGNLATPLPATVLMLWWGSCCCGLGWCGYLPACWPELSSWLHCGAELLPDSCGRCSSKQTQTVFVSERAPQCRNTAAYRTPWQRMLCRVFGRALAGFGASCMWAASAPRWCAATTCTYSAFFFALLLVSGMDLNTRLTWITPCRCNCWLCWVYPN